MQVTTLAWWPRHWADLGEGFMTLAAGAMIFVSLHQVLPAACQHGRVALFASGLAAGMAVYRLLGWLSSSV